MKSDNGKPKPTLCPAKIITAVARIRECRIKKYGDSDSWKDVERDTAFRHFVAYIKDPLGVDEESGFAILRFYINWKIEAAMIVEDIKNGIYEK